MFGTAWFVNALVFAGVLVAVYLAVETARWVRLPPSPGLYGALICALALAWIAPQGALLYGTARRMFGRRAAFFAAALFAGVGATQFLGAFATFDAMAIALLALATWLGVRAAGKGGRARRWSLVVAGAVLALANATKYASGLFDPVVIAVVMACVWRRRGAGAAAAGGAVMLTACAALIGIGLAAGGSGYWQGLTSTTLARAGDNVPASGVLYASAEWVGGIALLAVIGAIAAFAKRLSWPLRALACVLVTAVFLAPAGQARIHTITSMFKHVGFGAWFACIMAGFALACLGTAVPAVKARGAVRAGIAATILGAVAGAALAGGHFASWPGPPRLRRGWARWPASTVAPSWRITTFPSTTSPPCAGGAAR